MKLFSYVILISFCLVVMALQGCGSAGASQYPYKIPEDARYCECLTTVDSQGEAYEFCPNCFDKPTRFTDVWCFEETTMFEGEGPDKQPLASQCFPYNR